LLVLLPSEYPKKQGVFTGKYPIKQRQILPYKNHYNFNF
jgi:hypothetical protein